VAAWCFLTVMASVTVTTPLWRYYEQRYGLGSTGVSVAFGAMAVGVFLSLPIVGGLSDCLGRFTVMALALTISLLATAVFLVPGVLPLLVARVMQGCAVALMVSSAPPAINEGLAYAGRRRPALSASISTVANLGGLGLGSLFSALVVSISGRPFTAPYLCLAVLLVIALIVCGRLGLSQEGRQHWSLRLPKVPDGGLKPYIGAGVSGLAAFAAFSVYASLGPGVLSDTFGVRSSFSGPELYCVVMACSAIGQLALMRLPDVWRRGLSIGLFVMGFTMISASTGVFSLPLFVAGGLVLGLGSGLIFADASRVVTSRSHVATAAASQAGFFMMAYVGMVVPIVGLASLFSVIGTTAAFAFTGGMLSVLVVIGTSLTA
jgi:hypothetical protein